MTDSFFLKGHKVDDNKNTETVIVLPYRHYEISICVTAPQGPNGPDLRGNHSEMRIYEIFNGPTIVENALGSSPATKYSEDVTKEVLVIMGKADEHWIRGDASSLSMVMGILATRPPGALSKTTVLRPNASTAVKIIRGENK